MIKLTLSEIVARLGGEIRGDANTSILQIATLENADQGSIAFLSNPKYQKLLAQTRASAVILSPDFADRCSVPCIITAQPYLYFARLAQWLNPPQKPAKGLHATASSESDIPASVSVGAGTRIGANVKLGLNVIIGENCVIGDGVEIGEGSLLHAGCVLYHATCIGKRVIMHSGAVIGSDGFGFARSRFHKPERSGLAMMSRSAPTQRLIVVR